MTDTNYENNFSTEIKQLYEDTCAIKSQEIILNAHGIDISEEELRQEAITQGWYAPEYGTPMTDVGNLLESHGMEVHKYIHASMTDLKNELAQGHQVIVGVDSGELWSHGFDETMEDLIDGEQADHALLVSGFSIDPLTAESNILLTDPGTGGICVEYPEDTFEDAWDDSDNFMVSII